MKVIMIGNGFSIDIIDKLGKSEEINLINLFSHGADVPWPSSLEKGFLSYKRCKSLWTLGARTTSSNEECINLIEDIITCINVYNFAKQKKASQFSNDDNIYIKAYGELTTYLRYLFIYYNNKISDNELKKLNHPIIDLINKSISEDEEVVIVNYNYDILLERLLDVNKIQYSVVGFDTTPEKVKLIKPHGSISFSFNIKVNGPFSIRHSEVDSISQNIDSFELKYNLENDYPIVNAIIPPAGDSNRSELGWLKVLKENTTELMNKVTSNDSLIIIGISYWHVDRAEIDSILTKLDPKMNVISVNPKPTTCYDAVLTSLFDNYVHFKDIKLLEA